MPNTCTMFRFGVRFDQMYNDVPIEQRSRAGSWPQKLVSMGFRLDATYCTHKKNIHHRIAQSAPHPLKTFYVNVDTVIRNYPDLKTKIEQAVTSLNGEASSTQPADAGTSNGQQGIVHGVVTGQPSGDTGELVPQERRSETRLLDSISPIVLRDDERFVDTDGQPLAIRVYGVRTKQGIRFDKADMFAAFGRTQRTDPNFFQATTMNIDDSEGVVQRDVITMWQFVELVAHCKRHGSNNAELVFDWVISVVFSAQFGDGTSTTQADHAMGVGDTLPIEFGKDVCGAYSYTILEGEADVVETFPCIGDKLKELGVEDNEWSLKKGGHSENMRGRLQSSDVKALLALHPKARISRGHFWHAPTKSMACKIEGCIRDDPIAKYRIRLPECSSTELFVLPHSLEDWLHEEGQSIANKIITQAVDRSELTALKIECKHRDEMAALHNEMAKMRDDKDAQITKLRDEKVKIAHAAARMLCPKKKLVTLDHLFET